MTTPNRTQLMEAGILVARGGIDKFLASDFADACAEVFDSEAKLEDSTDRHIEGTVNTLYFPAEKAFGRLGSSAIWALTAYHPATDTRRKRIALNQQLPFSAQYFHPDGNPAVIIHGSDNGAFDFSLEPYDRNFAYDTKRPAPQKVFTVELGAGDVVIHTLPHVLHRGRNLGSETRYTMVMGV